MGSIADIALFALADERVVSMEQAVISAKPRTETGTSSCHKLRQQGRVPAVIYGHGKPARAISLEALELNRFLARYPLSTIVKLASDDAGINGTTVMMKEVQKNPTKGSVAHVDLLEISLTETVTVSVPVVPVGHQASDGGVLEHVLNEVTVEAVVTNIPPQLAVDVTGLSIGESRRVSDIALPEGVKVMDDADQVVVHVIAPRVAEEAKPAAATEGAEGAEAAGRGQA